jgi:hypothetical protein
MPTSYATGTVAVTNGSKTFTGTGVAWLPATVVQGDELFIPALNASAIIDSIDSPGYASGTFMDPIAVTPISGTVTITIASPGVIAFPAGYAPQPNDGIKLATTGALPTGLTAGTEYYIVGSSISGSSASVSASPGGAAINTSGSQSGTHTATVVDYAYRIIPNSWQRNDPSLTQATTRQLLTLLAGAGVIYSVTGAAPDPGIGDDGQYALKTNAGAWQQWLKVSGAWVLQATPIGINSRGVWDSGTAYVVNDIVDRNGRAYLAFLDSTNVDPATNPGTWGLIGAKGDTGATPVIQGTSTSSVTAGAGSRSFTTQSGIAWQSGQRLVATSADLSISLSGLVTSYSGAALVINVDGVNGAGTASSWTISVGGLQGIQGATGGPGPVGTQGPTPVISGTSTSSVSVGTGSASFSTQLGIAWTFGQRLRVISADVSKIMEGVLTSYSGSMLTIDVDDVEGSGAASNWFISIAGEKGDDGSQGIQGDQGEGISPNATGTLAQRAAYDNESPPFIFMETDVSPFVLFAKDSNTTADWSSGMPIGGTVPVGDLGSVTDSVLESFDYGLAA